MRYKVKFEYADIDFGFEGEPYEVTRESTRYFNGYTAYQNFLQELDMAGDATTVIVGEESISNIKAFFYETLAKVIYILHGYNYRIFQEAFYGCMHKALVNVMCSDLCYKFDNKGNNE